MASPVISPKIAQTPARTVWEEEQIIESATTADILVISLVIVLTKITNNVNHELVKMDATIVAPMVILPVTAQQHHKDKDKEEAVQTQSVTTVAEWVTSHMPVPAKRRNKSTLHSKAQFT